MAKKKFVYKYAHQRPPQKRQAEMAQTWQADIHDKKSQKTSYDKRQKNIFCTKMFAHKILGVPLLQCFS